MFKQAFKRLFLILFPISLFALALFLTRFDSNSTSSSFQNSHLTASCPFYLGLSFFPIREKQAVPNLSSWRDNLLAERDFIKKIQDLKRHNKALSFKNVIFVFPVALTREEEWIISQKTFFIFPTGERKEISHLSYSEIQDFYKHSKASIRLLKLNPYEQSSLRAKAVPLKLKKVFSHLPKSASFLLLLKGSHREKIIRNLKKSLANKKTETIYLSSSNEKLLKDLLTLDSDWLILHSFKTLLRRELLSMWSHSFKTLPGEGLIIPPAFAPFFQNLATRQQKLLFFEKDPPYNLQDQALIQQAQGLISSRPHLALRSIRNKRTCFIKN